MRWGRPFGFWALRPEQEQPMSDESRDPLMDEPSFSIAEFCRAEKLSETFYYKLRRMGLGPRETRFPGSNLVRISTRARRDWHVMVDKWTEENAAQLAREQELRVEQARRAGKVAAASELHYCRRPLLEKLGKKRKAKR
jgi:hypothetical protein